MAVPELSRFFAAGWTLSIASWNAWMIGRADEARARIRRAFASIDDDAFSQASVRWVAARLYVLLREPQEAARIAEEAIGLCAERGFREMGWWVSVDRGWAAAQLGRVSEELDLVRSAMIASRDAGSVPMFTALLTCFAEVQRLSGAIDEAGRTLDEALCLVPEEGSWRPETMRLRGEVRRWQGDDKDAETAFREAMTLAQEMSAKAWELRCRFLT